MHCKCTDWVAIMNAVENKKPVLCIRGITTGFVVMEIFRSSAILDAIQPPVLLPLIAAGAFGSNVPA